MDNRTRLKAYQWLVDLMRRNPQGLTFDEINDRWTRTSMSEGDELADATFRRWRDHIRKDMHIKIECPKGGNGYRYKITYEDSYPGNRLEEWMFNAFALSSKLSRCEDISDRILLESFPMTDFLDDIISALKKNRRVTLTYRDYDQTEAEQIVIDPYCLKTYHHRWYLLGRKTDGDYRIFCLDRIEGYNITKERFVLDGDFDAQDFFAEYYSVRIEKKVEKEHIVLRAYKKQRFKIKNQPIHHSQEESVSGVCMFGDEEWPYPDFTLDLRPTYDFVSYLESLGRYIEVMEPLTLREELLQVHRDAIERNKI